MKYLQILSCLLGGFSFLNATGQASATTSKAAVTYSNPLPVKFGDPYVLYTNGRYYMYGTGAGAKNGFSCYASADLVNWKPVGQVYFGTKGNSWGVHSFW